MSKYPGFIRRLLSTAQYGRFDPYDDPYALAADWPMNGDRDWAIRCAAWLDEYLSRNPTAEESFDLVFSGWHNCDLLVHEEDFTKLLKGIRKKISSKIPNWDHSYYAKYLFDSNDEINVNEPTLSCFVEPFNPFPHEHIPDLFSAAWLARYALECREKPELLDRIISELQSVLFHLRSNEEIDAVWRYTGVGYTSPNGGIRHLLTMALGAFETAKLSMSVPTRRARKFCK